MILVFMRIESKIVKLFDVSLTSILLCTRRVGIYTNVSFSLFTLFVPLVQIDPDPVITEKDLCLQ